MNDVGKNDIWLAIIALISGFVTMLKNYDDLNQNITIFARIRKLIVGCIGSFVVVFACYELLFYIGLPNRLCLALSALLGYLGGEFSINFILKYVEIFLVKKIDKKIDKEG